MLKRLITVNLETRDKNTSTTDTGADKIKGRIRIYGEGRRCLRNYALHYFYYVIHY